jgi:hypothetical protein
MEDGKDGWAVMKISLLVEGRTEKAFLPHLRRFLEARLFARMPNIDILPYHGLIPKGEKLKRVVENLLNDGNRASDVVVALTDVYTGTREFKDAADAKAKMRAWVGPESRFYPHVAQHDFEAWLLVFWVDIARLAGSNKNAPGKNPESIDHDKPPAYHIKELFEAGTCRSSYVKPRDANRILLGKDLLVSANACPELKALLNTILQLCGGDTIP